MNATQPLNCFISFNAASSHHAAQLTKLLHRMEVETYRADLPSQEISREIMIALRAADFVCLIIGEPSPSPNVAFEAGLAIGLGKPVLALATGPTIPFDFAEGVQVVRVPGDGFASAERDIIRFVRHVRPVSSTIVVPSGETRSLDWARPELARIRQTKGTRDREIALVDFVARVFESYGSEVLREGQEEGSRARIDLLVWNDPLVEEFGGPLIVECKYYAGGSGSVLVNARRAFRQLAGYVDQSNATVGILVFDHDRPTELSLTEQETPEALAFFVGDLLTAMTANKLGDEIRRRRARAVRVRGIRGNAG